MNQKRFLMAGVLLAFIFGAADPAHALDRCWYERHRAVYPPGARELKVHVGDQSSPKKFTETSDLFAYLKQADGKLCDVDWVGAKSQMEDWLSTHDNVESKFGTELTALIAKQQAGAAQPDKPEDSLQDKLDEIQARVSALGSHEFDSTAKRRAEIAEILKVIRR